MNVSIELLEFPLCVKNKILRIKNIAKLNIEYISDKNIVFDNSNLGLKELEKENKQLRMENDILNLAALIMGRK